MTRLCILDHLPSPLPPAEVYFALDALVEEELPEGVHVVGPGSAARPQTANWTEVGKVLRTRWEGALSPEFWYYFLNLLIEQGAEAYWILKELEALWASVGCGRVDLILGVRQATLRMILVAWAETRQLKVVLHV